jgi:hypothetical protein
MTISELVRKLIDAGANAEAVQIAIQAIEEEREPEPPRRHVRTKKPEIVAQRA